LFPADRMLQFRMIATLVLGVLGSAFVFAALAWLWLVFWPAGVVATVFVFAGWLAGSRATARMTRRGPDRDRVVGSLQRLSELASVGAPRVRLVEGTIPLSWTTALPGRSATISLTTGMIEACGQHELDAVLAHELGHVINGDASVMTIVGGPPTWMLAGIRKVYDSGGRASVAAVLVGPIAALACMPAALAARIVSRQRELAADRAAAILTGSPAAVASALTQVSGSLHHIPTRDLRAAAGRDLFHFLPARHTEPRRLARLWATHPPIKHRLARLENMERVLQGARRTLQATN
jgi:heat shock protein HtpX